MGRSRGGNQTILSLYVFLHIADPVGGGGGAGGTCLGGGGGHVPPHPEETVSILFFAHYSWWRFGVFWCRLGWSRVFNGPHDSYANRSNSQTILPHYRFTDSFASR